MAKLSSLKHRFTPSWLPKSCQSCSTLRNTGMGGNCLFRMLSYIYVGSGGFRGAGAPPPPGHPNSVDFMQFSGKFGKIVCWRPPPPRENPGSAAGWWGRGGGGGGLRICKKIFTKLSVILLNRTIHTCDNSWTSMIKYGVVYLHQSKMRHDEVWGLT